MEPLSKSISSVAPSPCRRGPAGARWLHVATHPTAATRLRFFPLVRSCCGRWISARVAAETVGVCRPLPVATGSHLSQNLSCGQCAIPAGEKVRAFARAHYVMLPPKSLIRTCAARRGRWAAKITSFSLRNLSSARGGQRAGASCMALCAGAHLTRRAKLYGLPAEKSEVGP